MFLNIKGKIKVNHTSHRPIKISPNHSN
jgi:hypothetical protein